MAIMCASAPALYTLLKKWFPDVFALKTRTNRPVIYTDSSRTFGKHRKIIITGGSSSSRKGTPNCKEMRDSQSSGSKENLVYDGIMRTYEVNIVYDNRV
jgi:hypothetical protein